MALFKIRFFKVLRVKVEISHVFTVPYRSQSNMVERVNRTLIEIISSYISFHNLNWDRILQHFAYALRTAVHELTEVIYRIVLGKKNFTPS